jgi:hypothetical protein
MVVNENACEHIKMMNSRRGLVWFGCELDKGHDEFHYHAKIGTWGDED